jgi:hypothetical protein
MSLPQNGDKLNSSDRIFTWARLLSPFVVGIIGALIGGFASFTITQQQVAQQGISITKLEARVSVIESNQSLVIERMARVETKIDILLNDARR